MFKILVITLCLACVYAGGDPYDTQAEITKYQFDLKPEGSYSYEFGTSNRIEQQESGVGSSYAVGSYSYTAPDGQLIQLQYTADENGFVPRGDHLPTPPPIPDYIVRALQYIESHPYPQVPSNIRKRSLSHLGN